jgi:hypothetical protein
VPAPAPVAVCFMDSLNLGKAKIFDEWRCFPRSAAQEHAKQLVPESVLLDNLLFFVNQSLKHIVKQKKACDLLLPIIVEYLKNVRICLWNIVDGQLVMQPQVYGEGGERCLNLLQTNVIVPHYDLMEVVTSSQA